MPRVLKSLCAMATLVAMTAGQGYIQANSLTKPYHDSVPSMWETFGTAVTTADFVRLTPDSGSTKGSVWGTRPLTARDWSAELEFEIQGNGRIGADGMGLWYTAASTYSEGDVFGAANRWRGLLVAIDTFDNDRKHDNPKIGVILNDGTKEYRADNDGSDLMVGGCVRNVRNVKHPAKIRVTYLGSRRTLAVEVDQNNNGDWEACWSGDDIDLPTGYFFGISAATGGLSDNHDVRSFTVSAVDPNTVNINVNNNNNNGNAGKNDDAVVKNEQKINGDEKVNEDGEQKNNDKLDDILRRAENIQHGRPADFEAAATPEHDVHHRVHSPPPPQHMEEEVKAEKVVEEKREMTGTSTYYQKEADVSDAEFDRVLKELENKVRNALESSSKCEEAMNGLKNELVGKINSNVFVQSNKIDFRQLESTIDALQKRIDTISIELDNLIGNVNKLGAETKDTIDSTNYMFWIMILGLEVVGVFAFIHFKNKSRNSAKKMF